MVDHLADVSGRDDSTPWVYSETVKEHFFNPQNFVAGEPPQDYDGLGLVGSPACGDMMKVWIKTDKENDRITDCKWQTFGCASAIAATSMMSVMVTENNGMKIVEALKITPSAILERLSGLPARKVHCSVLGDKALQAAINDYFRRSGQTDRIVEQSARVIDKVTRVTDKDIEEAVLHGARTVAEVQEMTKVGADNPTVLAEVEQLVRYYVEKYYPAS